MSVIKAAWGSFQDQSINILIFPMFLLHLGNDFCCKFGCILLVFKVPYKNISKCKTLDIIVICGYEFTLLALPSVVTKLVVYLAVINASLS